MDAKTKTGTDRPSTPAVEEKVTEYRKVTKYQRITQGVQQVNNSLKWLI